MLEAARLSSAAEPHPTVALVETGVRTHGPGVYGCLGINPGRDLRCELHRLFEQFVDERSEGRLPDFVSRHLDTLEAAFLDELRVRIAGLAQQVLEPVPAGIPRVKGTTVSAEPYHASLPRGAQRPRRWR